MRHPGFESRAAFQRYLHIAQGELAGLERRGDAAGLRAFGTAPLLQPLQLCYARSRLPAGHCAAVLPTDFLCVIMVLRRFSPPQRAAARATARLAPLGAGTRTVAAAAVAAGGLANAGLRVPLQQLWR